MLLNQEEADCLVYLKGLRVVYAAERSLIASGRNQGWGSNLVNFLILSFSARGLAWAGESPASRKRARRPPCLRGPARRPTGALWNLALNHS